MSDKVLIKKETMANIANAIREKNGGSYSYTPSEMAGAVASIGSGGSDGISMEEAKYWLSYNKKSNVESEKWPASYHFKYSEELSIPLSSKNVPQEFDYTFDIQNFSFNSAVCTFSSFGNYLTCNTGTTQKRIIRLPYLKDIKNQYSFYTSKITHIYIDSLTENTQNYTFSKCNYLRYLYIPSFTRFMVGSNVFKECGDSELGVVIYNEKATSISSSYFNGCNIKELVLNTDNLVTLQNISAFSNSWVETKTDKGFIFVKDELVDVFKNSTNWTTYADKIKPISEWGGEPA